VATLRGGRRRNPLTLVMPLLVLAVCLTAALGPFVAPNNPLATNRGEALRPPSWRMPCGTDQVGRDVCTRIVYAARLDLSIAVGSVLLALVVGSAIGAVAGYLMGRTDRLVM